MAEPVNQYIRDAFVKRGVRMTRVEATLIRKATSILQDLSDELASILGGTNFDSGSSEARLARLEKLKSKVDRIINGTYADLSDAMDADGITLAQNDIQWFAQTVNGYIGAEIMDVSVNMKLLKTLATDVLIQGAPSSAWWYKQGTDLAHKFMAEMRMGILQGEGSGDLIRRVRGRKENGFTDGVLSYSSSATRNAEALVRSSVMTVMNNTREQIYQDNADIIKGVQSVATLDLRTTPVCQAYDGACYDLDNNPIEDADGNVTDLPFLPVPRHWNCRTILVPILYSWEELANKFHGNSTLAKELDNVDESTRSSMDGQVPASMTYEDWLTQKDETDPNGVRDMLGPGKYELWKEGRVSLQDLIDNHGNPIPLDEL